MSVRKIARGVSHRCLDRRCRATLCWQALVALQLVFCGLLYSQPAATGSSPIRVDPLQTLLRKTGLVFTLHCLADQPLTDGVISLSLTKYGSKKPDSLTLWKGACDTAGFDVTEHYAFTFAVGTKAQVSGAFHASVAGTAAHASSTLYIFRFADTLLVSRESYDALDKAEIDHLIKKKGYENKTEDEIKTLDPELWNKMQKAKGKSPAPKK